MSHTVTITKLPSEGSDDYEYTFGGTHDGSCMVGKRCDRWACQTMNHEFETERMRHGLEHWWNWDNREWIVHDTEACALDHVFEYIGDIETFEEADVTLGTYTVEIRWEDTWWLEIGTRVKEVSP